MQTEEEVEGREEEQKGVHQGDEREAQQQAQLPQMASQHQALTGFALTARIWWCRWTPETPLSQRCRTFLWIPSPCKISCQKVDLDLPVSR